MRHCIKLLTLLLFFGCGQKETRKVVLRFDSGKEEIIHYYKNKDDTLSYRKEAFFETGKPYYVGNIVDNKKEGIWTWWYENGKKSDQCKYLNGKEIDTIYHWYDNGQLKQIDALRQGKPSADNTCSVCCNVTTTKYYDNGKLQEISTTVDDKHQGIHETHDKDGSWRIRTYKNDSLWGYTFEHLVDSDGVKLVTGQYENGEETGLWSWRDKDSILYQTATYKDGKYNGEYVKFYKNGKMKSKGNLVDGVYDGEVIYYDEKGNITDRENYKNGILQRKRKS